MSSFALTNKIVSRAGDPSLIRVFVRMCPRPLNVRSTDTWVQGSWLTSMASSASSLSSPFFASHHLITSVSNGAYISKEIFLILFSMSPSSGGLWFRLAARSFSTLESGPDAVVDVDGVGLSSTIGLSFTTVRYDFHVVSRCC